MTSTYLVMGLRERGTAKLLDIDHAPLKRMVLRKPPIVLKPFVNEAQSMVPTLVIRLVSKQIVFYVEEKNLKRGLSTICTFVSPTNELDIFNVTNEVKIWKN